MVLNTFNIILKINEYFSKTQEIICQLLRLAIKTAFNGDKTAIWETIV